jgi:hypothetical protein
VNVELAKKLNAYWYNSFLSNACRTFVYKLINNCLPYNHVLSHFVRDKSRNCTFCDISGNQEEEDETPLHLFYSCRVSENLRILFFEDFLNIFITRQEFFTITTRENTFSNTVLTLITMLFKTFLWDCKLNEVLPNIDFLKKLHNW